MQHDKIHANYEDPWQIRGNRLLETPSCQGIRRSEIASLTSLLRRIWLGGAIYKLPVSRLQPVVRLGGLSSPSHENTEVIIPLSHDTTVGLPSRWLVHQVRYSYQAFALHTVPIGYLDRCSSHDPRAYLPRSIRIRENSSPGHSVKRSIMLLYLIYGLLSGVQQFSDFSHYPFHPA